MNKLDPWKTAIAVGAFLAAWHIVWALLVAVGWAQAILDFVLWAHMLHLQYVAGPFDWIAALLLVIVTAAFGAAIGWVFATIWNWLHDRSVRS